MSKNRVQFQKGMSLSAFMAQYGTEEQCQQALFAWRWPQGFVCPSCGHTKACALKARRLLQCAACRHQCSLSSDTIFAGTKLPLRVWFLAMFLLTQAKNGLLALELSRQLGISYNSTWLMKHKLMQVMKEREAAKPLAGLIQLDDAYTGAGAAVASGAVAPEARRPWWPRWLPMRKVTRGGCGSAACAASDCARSRAGVSSISPRVATCAPMG
jgi:hypothetical protein